MVTEEAVSNWHGWVVLWWCRPLAGKGGQDAGRSEGERNRCHQTDLCKRRDESHVSHVRPASRDACWSASFYTRITPAKSILKIHPFVQRLHMDGGRLIGGESVFGRLCSSPQLVHCTCTRPHINLPLSGTNKQTNNQTNKQTTTYCSRVPNHGLGL